MLVGPSGTGKSTFAACHFAGAEVLHFIAAKRLGAGRLTVVDATNVQREARAPLGRLARDHDVLPVAITLDIPEKVCVERNADDSGLLQATRHVLVDLADADQVNRAVGWWDELTAGGGLGAKRFIRRYQPLTSNCLLEAAAGIEPAYGALQAPA